MNKTMLLLVNIETKGCKVLLPPKISLVHYKEKKDKILHTRTAVVV